MRTGFVRLANNGCHGIDPAVASPGVVDFEHSECGGLSDNDGREFVRSLARGLAVIQAFGPERRAMSISQVAKRTGMTRAATRRFLHTLEALGHVESDGNLFSLRPQVLSLGYAYLSSLGWWQVAQPYMEQVAARLRESCSASVLDGADIVYVARVPTTRIMTINLSVGTRLPAFVTSMGRVLLSHLDRGGLDAYFSEATFTRYTDRTVTEEHELREILARVREQGYCLVDQELEPGLRSLAVPILDRGGSALAAMNVGSHAARVAISEMLSSFLPELEEAAANITMGLPW